MDVERISFWISSERKRGNGFFKTCTLCGANLFSSETERLEFYGSHPAQVLCLSCKQALDSRSAPVRISSVIGSVVRKLANAVGEADTSRPTSVGVAALTTLVAACFILASTAVRLADSSTDAAPFEDIRDVVLLFVPFDSRDEQITQEVLAPYVSYLDEEGASKEWLFDSFLFLSIFSESKACFRESSTASDWEWWIDKLFTHGEQIDALNGEVERVKRVLGKPSKRGVIVSIPYPDPSVTDFGLRSERGNVLSFSGGTDLGEPDNRDRLEACVWYVDEVVENWKARARGYNNLEFLGFYWFQEELRDGDAELVNDLADEIHSRGYSLYWIPYNSEANIRAVQAYHLGSLSFDHIWIQPNWAFSRPGTHDRWDRERDLGHIAELASELGASIEVEMDQSLYEKGDLQSANYFYDYLDGGLTYGYMGRPLAYYVFPNDLYRSQNAAVRRCYDALCEFVKDRYRPASYLLHCDVGANDTSSRLSSIFLESSWDWGSAETVAGLSTRLASPGAGFAIDNLDPSKDLVVAIRYQGLGGGELQARLSDEWKALGTLEADGEWHTGHWRVEFSGRGPSRLVVRVTGLTRVSDVWAYPDETIFRLQTSEPRQRAPGLYSDATQVNGSWRVGPGHGVLFAETDPSMAWLVGISYKATGPVNMQASSKDVLQTVLLGQSLDWVNKVFLTQPGRGGSDICFEFDGEIELRDFWASPPRLHTNVGTPWDTSLQRHEPGGCLGQNWSASRSTSTNPAVTYRSGANGSTLLVNPLDASVGMSLTLLYRCGDAVIATMKGVGISVGTLPPAGEWSIHTIYLPPSSETISLELSGPLDLASIWVEAA